MDHRGGLRHPHPHGGDGPRGPLTTAPRSARGSGDGASAGAGGRAAVLADASLRGADVCRALSDRTDAWLQGLLADEAGVALLAVGGYGRRELCPGSDLDVVLVHRGRSDVDRLAERVWYPIWDAGVRLDHSVRTPKEALAVAGEDLKAAAGLLDGRAVAGDPSLAEEVVERAREQWRKGARRWLDVLAQSVAARHARFGEVAFLLEPDVKEGRGGLRDVAALRAAELATPVATGCEAALAGAAGVLLAVRVELHRATGRAADQLLLEDQDRVAAALGHEDADALMAAVALAARTVAWWSDDTWRRVASARAGPAGRAARRDRAVARGVVVREGEVVLAGDAGVRDDPGLVLRAAAAAAEEASCLARPALERLASEAPPMPSPWPPDALDALVRLLGAGHAAVPVLEALDQYGLLERIVPEWSAVRHRPQRNAYHRFTVDRHLCEAAANAASLLRRVARPDLLLVGAWLHDIGKGFPGDHTDAGVEVVGRMAPRMGFSTADTATLVCLVRHHLLLADAATRRDLDDPATVEAVAAAVGDRDTLDLLAALTEADSLATGPSAWGAWKAGLVADLVVRTGARLDGHHPPPPPALPTAEHRRLMVERALHVEVEADAGRLTVVAPDRPGLFCRVAGALAVHGLDVRAAAAAADSDAGMAVEVFDVAPTPGRAPSWDQVRADVARALAGRLPIEARLADRTRAYAPRARPAAARPAAARVLVDNTASATATVVEVRAPDGIGVLYRITRALADCELDVRSAKVTTLGHEVVDAFYVTDAGGHKITDDEHVAAIERSVLAELARLA